MAISKEEIIKHVIGEIERFELPEPAKVKVGNQTYENISEIVFVSVRGGAAGFLFIHGDSEECDLTCEEAFNLLLQNKNGEIMYAAEPFGVVLIVNNQNEVVKKLILIDCFDSNRVWITVDGDVFAIRTP